MPRGGLQGGGVCTAPKELFLGRFYHGWEVAGEETQGPSMPALEVFSL
jgi:hypothetical protein